MPINIIAEMRLEPARRAELMDALRDLEHASRAEPGNISYEIAEDRDEPNHVFVIEKWKSQKAIDEHMASGHFQRFGKIIAGKRKDQKITLLKPLFEDR